MSAFRLPGFLGMCVVALLATHALAQPPRTELLLYCGITMVRPMTEIAQLLEKRENVKMTIAQGASEELYQSAKRSGVGDWYLPGEPSYRDKHFAEGLFGEHVVVGYNQMALMVQEGNPRQIKPDPRELLRPDVVTILGNAESGSVGQEAKHILDRLGIYPDVIRAAAFLMPESRSLVTAMKKGEADVTLNWRATAYFHDNAAKLDAIDLDPRIARPQPLLLIQLKSSRHPELAKRLMQLAASDEGQAIFRKHGFLDNKTSAGK